VSFQILVQASHLNTPTLALEFCGKNEWPVSTSWEDKKGILNRNYWVKKADKDIMNYWFYKTKIYKPNALILWIEYVVKFIIRLISDP